MDFVVVGFGVGALAVLAGLWLGRATANGGVPGTPVRAAADRPERVRRRAGRLLALAGAALVAVTLLALVLDLDDRAGGLAVLAVLAVEVAGGLVVAARSLPRRAAARATARAQGDLPASDVARPAPPGSRPSGAPVAVAVAPAGAGGPEPERPGPNRSEVSPLADAPEGQVGDEAEPAADLAQPERSWPIGQEPAPSAESGAAAGLETALGREAGLEALDLDPDASDPLAPPAAGDPVEPPAAPANGVVEGDDAGAVDVGVRFGIDAADAVGAGSPPEEAGPDATGVGWPDEAPDEQEDAGHALDGEGNGDGSERPVRLVGGGGSGNRGNRGNRGE